MTALHRKRRQILAAATAGLSAAVAGCSGETTRTPYETPRDPREGPPPGATTDPEVRRLRDDAEEPFARLDADRDRHGGYLFVLDDAEATALAFDGEADGTDEVRSFVTATDFERETVVVVQRSIGECYDGRVEYVEPSADRFEARFCRVLKDATVPCEADSRVMEALFLRVPFAYEDRPSRIEGGESSRCRSDHWEDDR